MSTPIKVFMEGSPGGSMWPMPPETWDQICRGAIIDTDGLFVSVATARRLLAEKPMQVNIVAGPNQSGAPMFISDSWCGFEGGTPRRPTPDDAAPIETRACPQADVEDDDTDRQLAEELSESERHERIESEKADRWLDQQSDNNQQNQNNEN